MKLKFIAAAFSVLGFSPANAEETSPWYLHVGPTSLLFNESTTVTLGGAAAPGGGAPASVDITVNPQIASVGVSYRF